jgi:hypothetical protein
MPAEDMVSRQRVCEIYDCSDAIRAILTKYKANRSFVAQTRTLSFSPLEYDLVAGFTSTLFDNYMEYKQLVKNVQDMMANPSAYKTRPPSTLNYIPLDVDTLVAARAAFRVEMNKIVHAVDILSKDPHVLKDSGKLIAEPTNSKILDIIKNATKKSPALSETETKVFWDYKPQGDPAAKEPTGRYQWVLVERADKITAMNAQSKAKVQGEQPDPWSVKAWIEDNAKVLDRNVQPSVCDSNLNDRWGYAWITQFQKEEPAQPGSVDTGTDTDTDAGAKNDAGADANVNTSTDAGADGAGANVTSWEWGFVESVYFSEARPAQGLPSGPENTSSSGGSSNPVLTPESATSQQALSEQKTVDDSVAAAQTPRAAAPQAAETSSVNVTTGDAPASTQSTPVVDFDLMVRPLDML